MNDPLNITVAYPRVNRHQKSDKGTAGWLPLRNRCWFAARVVQVKRSRYGLTMDATEKAEIENVRTGCSDAETAAPACPAG